MPAGRVQIRLAGVAAIVTIAVFSVGAVGVRAAPTKAPVKLVPASHIGWEVNGATGANVCTVASKDPCRSGRQGATAGGFEYPSSVAVDPRTGNLYTTDDSNNRVQELTAAGAFVAMFGWDVNETEDRLAAGSQAQKNVCTATSGDTCGPGTRGAAAGQLDYPASVAVAPDTGAVYLLETETGEDRIDKYTSTGRFLWTAGKDVNATTKANICSEREIEQSHVKCQAGAEAASDTTEPAAFKSARYDGDLLAVGGPENLLYVGDEHRVQELEADGKWRGEILLASLSSGRGSAVSALALDRYGDLYLVYSVASSPSGTGDEQANVIRKFNPHGEQIAEFSVNPRQPKATVVVNGLAVDPDGELAVIGNEIGANPVTRLGALYDAGTGLPITSFTGPSDNDGITFNGAGDLYVAATDDQEVAAYVPAPVVELVTSPVACEVGPENDQLVMFDCALNRE